MPKLIDITGQRFGRLLVIGNAPQLPRQRRKVICVCDCGKIVNKDPRLMKRGCTLSCGCYQKDKATENCKNRAIHEKANSKEYTAWAHMKSRCLNPRNPKYKYYGARGIKVCDEWLNNFQQFYNDMGPKPHPKMSLDRIDVDGDYCASNCRWATQTEQMRNTRKTLYVELNGLKMPLKQACEIEGIAYSAALYRIYRGYNWLDVKRKDATGKVVKGSSYFKPELAKYLR